MNHHIRNTRKIINDPVLGFIQIPTALIFELMEHPWVQRLRRIKQLGLSYLVYPGANHSRFEHAVGTTHLMEQAVAVLRMKGHEITDAEAEAAMIAILLHDVGHAPFSHVLENTIVNIGHEEVSLLMMRQLNNEFNGKLSLAIQIFTSEHPKKFLHQLVSSQLDMDRLDYLGRDSFFTGVAEGIVGIDRIIYMLNVYDDELVIDAKGIYSVEKFLIARRLMYWNVYLHKTVVSAEFLLINVLKRAKELKTAGDYLYATPSLAFFLEQNITSGDFISEKITRGYSTVEWFALLDDSDILTSIKMWQFHPDLILSLLAKSIINRKLFKSRLKSKPLPEDQKKRITEAIVNEMGIPENLAPYLLMTGEITNNAYNHLDDKINVLYKTGKIREIGKASDINLSSLTKTVRKYFVCFPKELDNYEL